MLLTLQVRSLTLKLQSSVSRTDGVAEPSKLCLNTLNLVTQKVELEALEVTVSEFPSIVPNTRVLRHMMEKKIVSRRAFSMLSVARNK